MFLHFCPVSSLTHQGMKTVHFFSLLFSLVPVRPLVLSVQGLHMQFNICITVTLKRTCCPLSQTFPLMTCQGRLGLVSHANRSKGKYTQCLFSVRALGIEEQLFPGGLQLCFQINDFCGPQRWPWPSRARSRKLSRDRPAHSRDAWRMQEGPSMKMTARFASAARVQV